MAKREKRTHTIRTRVSQQLSQQLSQQVYTLSPFYPPPPPHVSHNPRSSYVPTSHRKFSHVHMYQRSVFPTYQTYQRILSHKQGRARGPRAASRQEPHGVQGEEHFCYRKVRSAQRRGFCVRRLTPRPPIAPGRSPLPLARPQPPHPTLPHPLPRLSPRIHTSL